MMMMMRMGMKDGGLLLIRDSEPEFEMLILIRGGLLPLCLDCDDDAGE